MKILGRLVIAGVALLALLQFVRPGIPAKPAAAEVQAPPAVRQILEKSCYSCHSDQRRLVWFDYIVPGYWLVRHDVLTARSRLDFSTLGSKPSAAQNGTLYEAVNFIQLGAMPLPRFLSLHPGAKVTPEELAALKAYLSPWSATTKQPGAAPTTVPGAMQPRVPLASVQPELDGFPLDTNFEDWRPLSFTDRGDNNTFRFVLGNDIAEKAAQTGNISPWPDGARFAKVAWQQAPGPDGLIYPGEFVQVELMLKDAQRYKKTEGWGWGRWRGLDLKPYGQNVRFVNECTSCHMPMRGNDAVYTLPMTSARVDHRQEVVNNNAAALPATLPYQPLGWGAITMYVEPKTHRIAALYGNDAAMQSVRSRGAGIAKRNPYPTGAVLALVTWAQRDDPHWFGARIPNVPQSVEFVQIAGAGGTISYRRFGGTGLTEDHTNAPAAVERMNFILNLAPVQLP